ncbi:heavy metal-associated isoprenylated plant protein 47-like [Oryza brachyantha]|nr:heavy metal-associated isoprenylated plant protein 47-like [Oryza brachyantha]
MAKQKIVINVPMSCDKCRSKAMALVASTGGVDSVALAGDGKDQVVVVGEVDSIKLITALRKKVGHATLVTVGEAKKEEKKPEPAATVVEYPYPWSCYTYAPPPPVVYSGTSSSWWF